MADVEMGACPEEQDCMHSRQDSKKSQVSQHGRLSMSKSLRRRYVCAAAVLLGAVMAGIIVFGIVRAMGHDEHREEEKEPFGATVDPSAEPPTTSEPHVSESPEPPPGDPEHVTSEGGSEVTSEGGSEVTSEGGSEVTSEGGSDVTSPPEEDPAEGAELESSTVGQEQSTAEAGSTQE